MPDAGKPEAAQPEAKTAETGEKSLLDEILQQTKMQPSGDGYALARKGVEAFISELLAPTREYEKADKRSVDLMIAEIDKKLSRQVDEILHHPDVQKLE